MIDYNHPLIAMRANITSEEENIFESRRYLKVLNSKFKGFFEETVLYKELKEKYATVTLEYIDEDETIVICTTYDLEVETLTFNTQELEGKL